MNSMFGYMSFDRLFDNPMCRMDYPYLLTEKKQKEISTKFKKYTGRDISTGYTVGKMPTVFSDDGKYYCVRSENLKDREVQLDTVMKMIDKEEFDIQPEGSKLFGGEFLMVSAGARSGYVAINHNYVEAVTNEAVTHIDINENIISKEYLLMVFEAPFVKEQIDNMRTKGATPNFKYAHFKHLVLPIPNTEEQSKTLPIVQNKIVKLKDIICRLEEEKERYSVRFLIDKAIEDNLNIKKNNKLVINQSAALSSRQDLLSDRLDLNYMIYKTSIENSQDDFSYVKIKKIASINQRTSTIKGEVINGRVIDFKDIISFTGEICEGYDENIKLESDKTSFANNDIMFSKFNPQFGKNVIVTEEMQSYVGSSELWGLSLDKNKIFPQYFIYALASTELFNSFCYLVTGAKLLLDGNGRSRITSTQFLNLKIPLPDIETQKRICSRIKEEREKIIEIDNQINLIKKVISDSADEYILNGYSENLFQIPHEVIK